MPYKLALISVLSKITRLVPITATLCTLIIGFHVRGQGTPQAGLGSVNALDWGTNNNIAIAYSSGTIQLRDQQNNFIKEFQLFSTAIQNQAVMPQVTSIAWSPDKTDHRIAISFRQFDNRGGILILDSETGDIVQAFPVNDIVGGVTWSLDSVLIAATVDDGGGSDDKKYVKVWNTKTGNVIGSFRVSQIGVEAEAWYPVNNHVLAIGSENGDVSIINIDNGTIVQDFNMGLNGDNYAVNSLAWNSDGSKFAASATYCNCIGFSPIEGLDSIKIHPSFVRIWAVPTGKIS